MSTMNAAEISALSKPQLPNVSDFVTLPIIVVDDNFFKVLFYLTGS